MLPPWSSSTIYQIFPLSYYDSNHDGKGDLQGIVQKLDYIAELGLDTIWLNPIYKSQWIDAGYDITDHTAIDPIFGNMSDFDTLIKQAHKRNLKVVIDLLPNHTSDGHPWFIESCESKKSLKRDWYTWHDPSPDGGPPNNWKAVFGGSAWTFDATTKQYYLHTFYPQQPDLNLRNPNVRNAIYSIMRFYLNRGVDGFRVDAASHFMKDIEYRDNPMREEEEFITDEYEKQQHVYDKNVVDRMYFLNEMASVLEEFPHAYMISESYLDLNQLQLLHKSTAVHNHTACNFYLMEIALGDKAVQETRKTAKWINTYLSVCHKTHAVPTWILDNHDRTRVASRYGHTAARMLAMLQLMLPGLAFVYYGDEIGMTETHIPPEYKHDKYEFHDRDAQRTPMHWSSTQNAGFTTAKPWLPLNPNYPIVNVEAQTGIETSFLTLYKKILELRNNSQPKETLRVEVDHKSVIKFNRGQYHVILNFSARDITLTHQRTVIVSTYGDKKKDELISELRPFEGVICSH